MKPLNPIERGIRGVVNPKYTHKDNKGTRVPGWEEVNFTRLAKDLGIDGPYLRLGITGRTRTGKDAVFTVKHMLRAADLLGLSMAELGARIDYTRKIDSMLQAQGVKRCEAHALLEGRQTASQQRRTARKPVEVFRYPAPRPLQPTTPQEIRKGF